MVFIPVSFWRQEVVTVAHGLHKNEVGAEGDTTVRRKANSGVRTPAILALGCPGAGYGLTIGALAVGRTLTLLEGACGKAAMIVAATCSARQR